MRVRAALRAAGAAFFRTSLGHALAGAGAAFRGSPFVGRRRRLPGQGLMRSCLVSFVFEDPADGPEPRGRGLVRVMVLALLIPVLGTGPGLFRRPALFWRRQIIAF